MRPSPYLTPIDGLGNLTRFLILLFSQPCWVGACIQTPTLMFLRFEGAGNPNVLRVEFPNGAMPRHQQQVINVAAISLDLTCHPKKITTRIHIVELTGFYVSGVRSVCQSATASTHRCVRRDALLQWPPRSPLDTRMVRRY